MPRARAEEHPAYSTEGVTEPYFHAKPGERTTRIVRHVVGPGFERIELRGPSRRRMIRGIVSTPTPDKHGDSLNPMGCIVELPLPLLFEHGLKIKKADSLERESIGEVTMLTKSPDGIVIEAVLSNSRAADVAWDRILKAEVRALSHLPQDMEWQGVLDGVRYIERWRMKEVSICEKGSNPDAVFVIAGNYNIDVY